jgi:hypothetical protein
MIYVEKIIAAVAIYAQEFQEPLTDDLARQFPGTQVMLKAHHHGVDIETHRCVEA